MNNKSLHRSALSIALGLCLASLAPVAMAQDGAVVGRADPGAQLLLTNPDTGFSRTVTASSDGSYRFSFIPVGTYTLQELEGGAPAGEPVRIRVTLGNATAANLAGAGAGAGGATDLAAVQVIGSSVVTPVDVTSTESATNITAEEVQRLPVDRDVASVALLAPGVNKGGASFGGISFGGSSVAENSYYINGLNVTDFYNRNAFSEAPFNFYREFQVKTGGYSVEFGRTTGGVVNAVAKSGSNEFHAGTNLTVEPRAWQSGANDRYFNGERYLTFSQDNYSQTKLDVWASGALIKDRLFFFAMYEGRDYQPRNTDDDGETLTQGESDDGFWGGTVDWNITDNNTLSLMAFSNQDSQVGSVYDYDFDAGARGLKTNEIYSESGGENWAVNWTSFFTSNLSMNLMYGENNRTSFNSSLNDVECNRVSAASGIPSPGVPLGCTTSSTVYSRDDTREQARADFEWTVGDHLLRFGLDYEVNTSQLDQRYPGPGGLFYNVYVGSPGSSIPNPPGGVVPPGYSGYVRARRNEISGNFETVNSAWYIEDNWSVTDNLVLNLGLRQEAFDNQDAAGNSYIKMDDMFAPRVGFSWDFRGDGTTKFFGNAGRYFLPVANVINIKQAGGLLDQRTYYAFGGWEIIDRNGGQYAMPILGPQIGGVDVSQGDGTVGDLRSEVDRDMDPVYQDEAILGFQSIINETWSWGVRGIYRKLNNAIDDMEISATAQCGEDGYVGWVMANPGEQVTVWGDTNCDGTADGWVDIDTANEGWALYRQDGVDADGDAIFTYIGQRGWTKPKRTYKALEFQLDRAWDDKWALNAAYTLAWSEGNAEGPVNSDTNFADTGRTENFDDPWVNLGGYGPLANDHRHQLKLRGAYAFNDNWQLGATVDARSGGPVTGFGVGNPFDTAVYHSYYICVENCDSEFSADRVYQHSRRGGAGRMPTTYELGASLTYLRSIGRADLRVKLSVFNLLNQQRKIRVDQELQTSVGMDEEDPTQPLLNEFFNVGYGFQAPRYAQLVVSLDF